MVTSVALIVWHICNWTISRPTKKLKGNGHWCDFYMFFHYYALSLLYNRYYNLLIFSTLKTVFNLQISLYVWYTDLFWCFYLNIPNYFSNRIIMKTDWRYLLFRIIHNMYFKYIIIINYVPNVMFTCCYFYFLIYETNFVIIWFYINTNIKWWLDRFIIAGAICRISCHQR